MQTKPLAVNSTTLILDWVTVLLGSLLPSILWNEFVGANAVWLTWPRPSNNLSAAPPG